MQISNPFDIRAGKALVAAIECLGVIQLETGGKQAIDSSVDTFRVREVARGRKESQQVAVLRPRCSRRAERKRTSQRQGKARAQNGAASGKEAVWMHRAGTMDAEVSAILHCRQESPCDQAP